MSEITLRLVDRNNWRATLYLAVLPEQQRFSALQLTVHPDNERARRLHAKAGFRPTGDVVDAELVYRLELLNPDGP